MYVSNFLHMFVLEKIRCHVRLRKHPKQVIVDERAKWPPNKPRPIPILIPQIFLPLSIVKSSFQKLETKLIKRNLPSGQRLFERENLRLRIGPHSPYLLLSFSKPPW